MKVLITEKIAKEAVEYIKNAGFIADELLSLSAEELQDKIKDYDALIVRSATKVNKELLSKADNLRVIGRAGSGVDNIDTDEATKKGIIVLNTPGGNSMAAAELAVGSAYSIFRNLHSANAAARKNDFRRARFIGNELDGKIAGIIGMGRIGEIVAKKLKGSNMRVIGYDPFATDERFKKIGIEKCDTLEDLLERADIISVHTPKTQQTLNLLGKNEFEKCKTGVRIVNAARSGIINEDDLYDALVSGKVAAAAIDVLNPEPEYNLEPERQDYKNKLLDLENVLITPHLGASTKEASLNVGMMISKFTVQALNGEIVPAVNMPQLGSICLEDLQPYLQIAEILGKIYYQVEKEKVEEIIILYSGEISKQTLKPITLSVLKGFLSTVYSERINYVNAESIINEMGIKYTESTTTSIESYKSLITVTFKTKKKDLSISGTVFGKDMLRIINFFGYIMDFEPAPHIIAIQNKDIPGMIGKTGTIFGDSKVNIASMQLSRNRRGGKAMSFISVDGSPPESLINALKNTDGILKVSTIEL
jgi:D-3-phosphoglycerate dehydrogenase